MLKILMALFLSLVMLACAQAAELPADFAAGEKRGWFSVKASPAEIIGADAAANFVKGMNADQDLEFLIYVPESWEPGTPIGLLSYITPRRQAILPAGWGSALDETNMIFVEHRYFLESTPEPCDWQYLTAENSAEDLHAMTTAFKTLYPGKWISTGISKGWQTSLLYRVFFPDDGLPLRASQSE